MLERLHRFNLVTKERREDHRHITSVLTEVTSYINYHTVRKFVASFTHKSILKHLAGADLYTTVIICLFASIIIILMFRSIRWKETSDDQVTVLLFSMQLRIDQEEGIRRKKKMRDAKLRAQLWLAELKLRSLNKISKSYRSASAYAVRPHEMSMSSAPMPMHAFPTKLVRTRSYNETLPAIVMQDKVMQGDSIGSRAISRRSSLCSDFHSECSYKQEALHFLIDGPHEV